MANDELPPTTPLGPWLQALLAHSELSYSALARAMGVDRSNVRAWLNGKDMNADSLLTFLDAVGAKVTPVEAPAAPRAMNSEMAEIRVRLGELEGRVADLPTAADLRHATGTLQEAIDRLARRDKPEDPPADKEVRQR